MNMELILANIKEELKYRIEGLTFQNLTKEKPEIDKIFNLLQAASEVTFKSTGALQQKEENEPKTTIETDEVDKKKPIKGESPVGQVFEFERKLRGGFISGLGKEGGYIVPERMVRDMGVSNGDKVEVIAERQDEDGQMKYFFKVVEKVNKIVPNRTELKYCRVEYEPYVGFYVSESQNGPIRLEEAPFSFKINEKDVQTFRLEKGDIVDAVYGDNDPVRTFRLLFKYNVDDDAAESTIESRKLSSIERILKKSPEENIVKDLPFDKELFQGKRVLIVGGAHRHHDFKDVFEEMGAEFEALTGDESQTTLEASIQKSDVVGIHFGENSHGTTIKTVELCKKHNVPFKSTGKFGLQTMVLCVEEAIKKKLNESISQS